MSTTKRKAPTRRPAPALPRRWWWRLAGLSVLATAAAGATWLWQSGWVEEQGERLTARFHQEVIAAGLSVQDLQVSGRKRTEAEAILTLTGIARGQSMLALDLQRIKRDLESLPWVGEARVARRLPDVVRIDLIERRPLALWQHEGRIRLIDHAGVPIEIENLKRFAGLPLVVGAEANRHAREIIAVIASEPDLREQVTAAVRVGGRRWNLRLDNGVDVKLPEDGIDAAFADLARLAREHALLERDVQVIDLRLPGRMILQGVPGGGEDQKPNQTGESA